MFEIVTRVAVTACNDRADGMAAELVAVGFRPVVLPCTVARAGAMEDIARMRGACEEVDLIVLDSLRPVELLWPHGALPSVPFAVSSEAIAVGVATRGGSVRWMGSGSCLDLVVSLDAGMADRTVAFPHAVDTDPRSIMSLADAARSLVSAPVYANHPVAPPATPVDAAVFVSALAVHGWAITRSFTGISVGVLGAQTRAALDRYDRRPDVETRATAYSDLSQALARYLA